MPASARNMLLNMPVRITLDAFAHRRFAGHVRRIADYVLDVEKQARTVADALEGLPGIDIVNQGGSTSLLQRKLKIGYGRAARIIDQLHEAGILGPPDGSKPREVYARKL